MDELTQGSPYNGSIRPLCYTPRLGLDLKCGTKLGLGSPAVLGGVRVYSATVNPASGFSSRLVVVRAMPSLWTTCPERMGIVWVMAPAVAGET